MKEIKLTQGKIALVDDQDYEWLNEWNWSTHWNDKYCYARRYDPFWGKIYMHRAILDSVFKDNTIDHIDHNGLNNQRSNLRIVNRSKNGRNRNKSLHNSQSKILGVSWIKRDRVWHAEMKVNGERFYLQTRDLQEAINYRRELEKLYVND